MTKLRTSRALARGITALALTGTLLGVQVGKGKAAEIVLEDSSLTPDRRDRGTWMFGPPVTPAEAAVGA